MPETRGDMEIDNNSLFWACYFQIGKKHQAPLSKLSTEAKHKTNPGTIHLPGMMLDAAKHSPYVCKHLCAHVLTTNMFLMFVVSGPCRSWRDYPFLEQLISKYITNSTRRVSFICKPTNAESTPQPFPLYLITRVIISLTPRPGNGQEGHLLHSENGWIYSRLIWLTLPHLFPHQNYTIKTHTLAHISPSLSLLASSPPVALCGMA